MHDTNRRPRFGLKRTQQSTNDVHELHYARLVRRCGCLDVQNKLFHPGLHLYKVAKVVYAHPYQHRVLCNKLLALFCACIRPVAPVLLGDARHTGFA
jgi:hypothetical protein